MSSAEKEQIYVQLRQYHLDEFPEVLSNSDMNALLSEYRTLEDSVIGMILALANGKSEYVDMSDILNEFEAKVKKQSPGKNTTADLEHFISKVTQLKQITEQASKASFTVRPQRKVRESTRKVTTTVTKK